jgi:hypothetical protein
MPAADSNCLQSGRKRTPKVAPSGLVLRRVGLGESPICVHNETGGGNHQMDLSRVTVFDLSR